MHSTEIGARLTLSVNAHTYTLGVYRGGVGGSMSVECLFSRTPSY